MVPWEAADTHFCAVGCTRSGKTVTMRILMQCALGRIRPGSGHRALVFDAKGDVLSILHGMELGCEVKSLHPMDLRGYAWDIAADVTDVNRLKTIAALLVPEEDEPQKYFPRSARAILEGVLFAFIKRAPGRWDLEDVLLWWSNATRTSRRHLTR